MYLGIDQGSSSTKAVLCDENAQVVWEGQISVSSKLEQKEDYMLAEQDADELFNSLSTLISEAKQKYPNIEAMGLASQSSGALAYSKDYKPLSLVLTHRDSRCAKSFSALSKEERQHIYRRSGIHPNERHAGPKIALLQKEYPNDFVSTLDSYLISRLCNLTKSVISDSFAARSLLYSLDSLDYDPSLCKLLGVEMERLPQVTPTHSSFGKSCGIEVSALLRDQYAALYAFSSSQKSNCLNFGTIASFIQLGEIKKEAYHQSIFYSDAEKPHFLLDAVMPSCGDILKSYSELAGLTSIKELSSHYRELSPDELQFLDASAGSGPPSWFVSPQPKIDLQNIQPDVIVSAAIQNLCFLLTKSLEPLELPETMYCSGGLSACTPILELLSGLLKRKLVAAGNRSSGALGAALAARDSLLKKRIYRPKEEEGGIEKALSANTRARYQSWNQLYEKSKEDYSRE